MFNFAAMNKHIPSLPACSVTARKYLAVLWLSCTIIAGCSEEPHTEQTNLRTPVRQEKNQAKAADKNTEAWVKNQLFGLTFETPGRMVNQNMGLPAGMELYAREVHAYTYTDQVIAVNFSAVEMIGDSYDTKGGLGGAVGNLVNHLGGKTERLDFGKVPGLKNAVNCYGTFTYDDSPAEVRGFCHFDEKTRRALILVAVAPGKDKKSAAKVNRIFKSLAYNSGAA